MSAKKNTTKYTNKNSSTDDVDLDEDDKSILSDSSKQFDDEDNGSEADDDRLQDRPQDRPQDQQEEEEEEEEEEDEDEEVKR